MCFLREISIYTGRQSKDRNLFGKHSYVELPPNYLENCRMGSVMLLWPNEGRFQTPGFQGASSNCRSLPTVASLAWKR
jgi:hypothetical protein